MDRITVMSWLEGLTDPDWSHFHSDSEVQNIASEALSLLKEDCHNCKLECLLQKYDQLEEKYDKLLKEQEAVEPKTTITYNGFHYDYCGNCSRLLPVAQDFEKAKFCPSCGKAVKWNE